MPVGVKPGSKSETKLEITTWNWLISYLKCSKVVPLVLLWTTSVGCAQNRSALSFFTLGHFPSRWWLRGRPKLLSPRTEILRLRWWSGWAWYTRCFRQTRKIPILRCYIGHRVDIWLRWAVGGFVLSILQNHTNRDRIRFYRFGTNWSTRSSPKWWCD